MILPMLIKYAGLFLRLKCWEIELDFFFPLTINNKLPVLKATKENNSEIFYTFITCSASYSKWTFSVSCRPWELEPYHLVPILPSLLLFCQSTGILATRSSIVALKWSKRKWIWFENGFSEILLRVNVHWDYLNTLYGFKLHQEQDIYSYCSLL